jgi:hypothetical protein
MKNFLIFILISFVSLSIISCSEEKEEFTTTDNTTTTSDNTTTTSDNTTTTSDNTTTTTTLSAPSGFSATGAAGQVTLAWTALSGASSYTMFWGTASGITSSNYAITSISTNSYTHTGRDNGTTYYYKVAAVDSAGTGTLSSEVSAATPLPAPANFTATAGNGQNTLDWDNVTGATSYTVYWDNSTGVSSSSTAITSISSDNYTHSSLTNGSTYYYKVAAVNSVGTGTLSSEASATPAAPAYKLPDTGQTASYTTTFGEDNDYLINAPSFIINDDDTVTDNNTQLMWQRQDDGTTRIWADAEPYCSGLSLGGQSDWRIPEPYELQTIVDYGKSSPSLDATYFTGTNSTGYYWSTNYLGSSGNVWYMRVGNGTVGDLGKTNTQYVRCVRGTNTTRSFTDNSDSTVTDTKTGLIWQQTTASQRNWESSLSYCESLTLGSKSDWRLPNIKELGSIVDVSEYNPAIDETAFPDTESSDYWSSTTWRTSTTWAWRVDFNGGIAYQRNKSEDSASQTANKYVRCVRGGH